MAKRGAGSGAERVVLLGVDWGVVGGCWGLGCWGWGFGSLGVDCRLLGVGGWLGIGHYWKWREPSAEQCSTC